MSALLCGWDDGNPHAEHAAILQRFVGWAAANIAHVERPSVFGPCTCIAIVPERRLDAAPLAVVVYHNHDARNGALEISMAAATPRWATRGTISACLHYPFVQLGCGVVACRVPRDAKRTKRFLSGIGFRATGAIPHGYGRGRDCSIYCLTREWAARWLGPEVRDARAA